jgi:hypothetical protein
LQAAPMAKNWAGERIAAPRPQPDATAVVRGDAAITVKFDLVEPVRPRGQLSNAHGVHGSTRPIFTGAGFGM